jgi:hypothetical protein
LATAQQIIIPFGVRGWALGHGSKALGSTGLGSRHALILHNEHIIINVNGIIPNVGKLLMSCLVTSLLTSRGMIIDHVGG